MRTSGTQTVSGVKSFTNLLNANSGISTTDLVANTSISAPTIYGGLDAVIDSFNGVLLLTDPRLDWVNQVLYGAWTTDEPTLSSGVVNRSYLESNARLYNKTTFSFFTDAPTTGNNLGEQFVGSDFIFTGLKLGCVQSGTGPLNSGPLSGDIYQRGTGNNKVVITTFSFDSGIFYKQVGGFNLPVSGDSRIGFDIFSGLSGIRQLTVGALGYLQY